jgi:hypothetical protein
MLPFAALAVFVACRTRERGMGMGELEQKTHKHGANPDHAMYVADHHRDPTARHKGLPVRSPIVVESHEGHGGTLL